MHPVLIALIVVDLVGVAAIAVAMLHSLRVSLGWSPEAASAVQLGLERRAEEASATGRLGLFLHAIATAAFLGAANHVLPALVPGAMCGTGVMQALPDGWLAASMRGLSLLALCAWVAVDRLNRSSPTGPLTPQASRWLLLSGALAIAAAWSTASSLLGLDLHRAVSCCAAVYDLAAASGSGGWKSHVAGPDQAWLLAGLGVGLIVWRKLASQRADSVAVVVAAAAGAASFVALGTWVLVDWTGPVLYGTLGHRCPMCLFLPRHGAVGYVAFGLLAWLAVKATSAVSVVLVSRAARRTRRHAAERARSAFRRVSLAAAGFLLIALFPPLLWWIRFGVWIGG